MDLKALMKCSSLRFTQTNCRCTLSPFVQEFKTQKEMEEARNRSSIFDAGNDPRSDKQKRQYQKEQAARRKANAEKKQYARWKMTLGDDAPKTLGGFRRMKRQNTTNFQGLQSEYMSIAQQAARE